MHGRFHRLAGAGLALTALSGCVQATRHSNTMLFGTNTTFGLKAGTATGNVPEVVVGYDRQEAVIMPLVANVEGKGPGNRLSPCNTAEAVRVNGSADFAVHPCSLVGVNGRAMDSYSVLASFGATFDADSTGAAGGLAQYFATGIAAQILALKGGAALVATGQGAIESAKTPANTGVAALLMGRPEFRVAERLGRETRSFTDDLLGKIRATTPANLIVRLKDFEGKLKLDTGAIEACETKTPDACADFIAGRDIYADYYSTERAAEFRTALQNWTVP